MAGRTQTAMPPGWHRQQAAFWLMRAARWRDHLAYRISVWPNDAEGQESTSLWARQALGNAAMHRRLAGRILP